MSSPVPYTYYACSCSEGTRDPGSVGVGAEQTTESSFDPYDARAAYALNSLDYLLFCDDCNQIRCARCMNEEVLNWYCPNCLFETHSTGVRGDGNRCSRNCYNCPVCFSNAIVTRQQSSDIGSHPAQTSEDSYILVCQYCSWTSLQINLSFMKPNKITEQINQARKADPKDAQQTEELMHRKARWVADERFNSLSSFYRDQLIDPDGVGGRNAIGAYGSPSNLARIIQLYGGLSHKTLAKVQDRPRAMREASTEDGLSTYDRSREEAVMVDQIHKYGYEHFSSAIQQDFTPSNFDEQSPETLWPAATKLRTKRGKRCRQCRQLLVRPEPKTTSLRYKIRILARNHIPRLTVRPLNDTTSSQHPSFVLRNEATAEAAVLQSYKTYQYVLTLRNPITEAVKVSLATPGTIRNRPGSRVTILCPSFRIGPAGDLWEDALSNPTMGLGLVDGGRKAAMASLTGSNDGDRQPEAGKVWEQVRNSTAVILEVVAAPLASSYQGKQPLEIPVSIRVEWTAEGAQEDGQKGKAEPKELQYWCVIGVGKVADA